MCLFFKLGNESPSYSISTAFKILQGDEKGAKRDRFNTLYLQKKSVKWLETILKVGKNTPILSTLLCGLPIDSIGKNL